MTLSAAAAAATTTAVVKKVVDEVFEYIKKIPAQFAADRSSVKDRSVATALNRITKVKTLWNTEKEISLYKFYFPSRVIFQDDVIKAVDGLKDLGPLRNIVIQGTAGQGKSIFLRFLCGQEISDKTSTGRIPLFIELRRIRADYSLNRLIIEAIEKIKFPANIDAWKIYARSGKFVLLLDAFDEIDPAYVQSAISELEHLSDIYHDSLQIIITSRPDSDIQNSAGFRVFRLCPLSEENHLPLLKKLCTEKGQAESLHTVLKQSSADVSNLLTTPLMVTLLVILYKSLQTIPDTVPKFYEELFDVLFYRHDHSKPGFRRKRHTDLDDSAIKKLFAAFCFYTRLKNYGVLSDAQLVECCELASKVNNVTINPQKFKLEISKTVCLMQQDGFEMSFIHKSVVQYYAASFVAKSSEQFSESFYKMVSKKFIEWSLEIRFLSDIDTYRYSKYFYLPSADVFFNKTLIDFSKPDDENIDILGKYLSKNSIFRGYTFNNEELTFPLPKNILFGGFRRKGSVDKFEYEVSLAWNISLLRLFDFKWGFDGSKYSLENPIDIFVEDLIKTVPEQDVRSITEQTYFSMKASHEEALASLRAEEEKLQIMAGLLPMV